MGIESIQNDFPQFIYKPARVNMYSPRNRTIHYDVKRITTSNGLMGVLHELGHAVLDHRSYKYDIELLNFEMDAWDFARQMAPRYGLKIDEDHIRRSIATYDQWLSKRATCPDCSNFCLQHGRFEFRCFACGASWKVNIRLDRRVKRTLISRFEPVFAERSGRSIGSSPETIA